MKKNEDVFFQDPSNTARYSFSAVAPSVFQKGDDENMKKNED